MSAAGQNFKVHLDGYDQRDLLRKGPDKRREFFYWTDDGNLAGLRYDQWKAVFLEQKAEGLRVSGNSRWCNCVFPCCSICALIRSSGRSTKSGDYVRWFIEHAFVVVPAQAIVGQHLASFVQFPPRQRPGSFSVEQAMEKLRLPPSSN